MPSKHYLKSTPKVFKFRPQKVDVNKELQCVAHFTLDLLLLSYLT